MSNEYLVYVPYNDLKFLEEIRNHMDKLKKQCGEIKFGYDKEKDETFIQMSPENMKQVRKIILEIKEFMEY